MADIKIINLSGSDLFNDAESFMSEINNEVTDSILGGLNIYCRNTNCHETVNCGQGVSLCYPVTYDNNPPGCYRSYYGY